MPLNYLQLQHQIEHYILHTEQTRRELISKLEIAQGLLRNCGQRHSEIYAFVNERITAQQSGMRSALLADSPADSIFDPPSSDLSYILLASDGSQIIPNPHDALPVALINTSRLCLKPGSGQAPEVSVSTKLLINGIDRNRSEKLREDLIALKRDVEEMRVLGEWQNGANLPVIALGDGPLELFHQPQNDEAFSREFKAYQTELGILHEKGVTAAGYTDRPRADLVVRMLEFSDPERQQIDLYGLDDLALFIPLLAPGQRSAIFELWSTSSQKYMGILALHFFYLNTGSQKFPWIARVEIPAWVAHDPHQVSLLHGALLEQCRLMGTRPYPYLLHRAHEEAVVSYEETEQLIARLSADLQRQGLGISAQSHKLSAKGLQSRTRMAK